MSGTEHNARGHIKTPAMLTPTYTNIIISNFCCCFVDIPSRSGCVQGERGNMWMWDFGATTSYYNSELWVYWLAVDDDTGLERQSLGGSRRWEKGIATSVPYSIGNLAIGTIS